MAIERRVGRPRIQDNEKVILRSKIFYYPFNNHYYDLIYNEFEELSNIMCGEKYPQRYKAHDERRSGFILRKLIFQFVGKHTKNNEVKVALRKVLQQEEEESLVRYCENKGLNFDEEVKKIKLKRELEKNKK